VSRGDWYQVSLPPSTPPTLSRILDHAQHVRGAGDGARMSFDLLCNATCLTVAAPAVMHVISADTTVADTIRYGTPSIGSDTIPIR